MDHQINITATKMSNESQNIICGLHYKELGN